MTESAHPSDPSGQPMVHVLDDYADFRDGLVYSLQAHGLEARGHPSGEAFFAAYRWGWRGVITLDIDFEPPGAASGLQIFDRLLALRCPMPVIFLTGPHGHDVRLAVSQVTRRADVDFYAKQTAPAELRAAIGRAMAREPLLRERAEQERRLLQIVVAELTPAEREVLARVLRGQTNYGIACELGKEEGVVELQRASGLRKVLGERRSPQALVEELKPLIDAQGASDLVDLARRELRERLALLSPLQQGLLEAALAGRSDVQIARQLGWHDEADRERRWRPRVQEALDDALALLQARSTTQLRRWLAWLDQRGG